MVTAHPPASAVYYKQAKQQHKHAFSMSLTQAAIKQRLQDLRNKTKLHAAARAQVILLKEENEELKQTNDELREEIEALKKQLEAQEDANKKLRAMLFERQHGTLRTKRSHTPTPRTTASYTRPQPREITECKELLLTHCPDCETPVSDSVSARTRIIEDIVFNPKPHVTKWAIHRHWCRGCGKQVAGTIPGILPKTRIGPHTLTFVVIAKYRWNQPYAKIQDQLKTTFGLTISQGEIAHLITRAADLVGDKWQKIIVAVRSGQTVHCDETGWHINGQKVWAHTFATEHAVLYEISPTRGKQIAENQLRGFTGTRVTDCLPNYKNLSGAHQICWAHLTREAQENMRREEDSNERRYLSRKLDTIYTALREVTNQEPWDQGRADRIKQRCQRQVLSLTKQHWQDPASQRLVTRLMDFEQALFTCLTASGIPPDNNHAERVLRKLVVQRKISGGNRSPTHAEHHSKLMSVVETLRLEEGDLLTNLHRVLQRGVAVQLSGG